MTRSELFTHYKSVAEQYRTAAILIRGGLPAWRHERSVQAASDEACGDGASPDYYRADGAINAINHLAMAADEKRRKFEALAVAAAESDEALAKARREHSR